MGMKIAGKPASQNNYGAGLTLRPRDLDKQRRRHHREMKATDRAVARTMRRSAPSPVVADMQRELKKIRAKRVVDVYSVACPACGAEEGKPCITANGTKAKKPHQPRQVAAWDADKAANG